MEKNETVSAVFDYTSFLGASCKKKWTFLEILTSIAPVFSTVWKDSLNDSARPEDRLWEQAFNTLSAQNSDESNLIRLVKLAKIEGIGELKLMMPYELDQQQLELISEKTNAKILHVDKDEFVIGL
ncbi:transporter [Vibrio sp. SCSIO 43137]|uniref:transporter n=1 Tax=Vibrio sp. SCSIO 43137 TaxID=3021011 RepID=UPI0023080132|nr:transporter [Vibrio sp. SCSIO 43137]WCE30968.1 transporter [Vibrio sp. SCSIO 43137]